MFNPFAKPAPKAAHLIRRVLIVDPAPAASLALGELLRELGRPEIWAAPTHAKALKLAAKVDPDLILCALDQDGLDGAAFTRALRRSDLACRKAPVILTVAQGEAALLLAGRDAGAHEILRRPFVRKELARRLEAAVSQPRGWVEAMDYVGPDRRRFNSAEVDGPQRRLADHDAMPQGVRIAEALKIARAALAALERDPRQAARALIAQTEELEKAAAETSDARLAQFTAELRGWLLEAAGGELDPAAARQRAANLLAYGGREGRAAA